MTILYPSPIFGPIHSRRLGISLGINLMPADGKLCTFDCVYCECGFNSDHRTHSPRPSRKEVATALEARLKKMHTEGVLPDVLTFAGNGEPTCHPDFAGIIEDTIRLRNDYCPDAKVSVLSNSTMIHRPDVFDALMKVDNNILKLDTISTEYINRVDRPYGKYDVQEIIDGLCAFKGKVIIQTLFMKGRTGDFNVDNTGDEYVLPWLEVVKKIAPEQVMIYTIDRETPDHDLQKATHKELDRIVELVQAAGFKASASY